MAARDIMPFKSPLGGTYEVRVAGMTASEVFDVGEPVAIVDGGTLTEPPDDATQWILTDGEDGGTSVGIACYGPGTGGVNTNPKTNAAYTTNDEIAYWPASQGTLFITQNVFAAGAGSASAPLVTDIGERYQISYGTTDPIGWGVEKTAGVIGVDVQAVVVDVLDSQKAPIRVSGNAGVFVVFEINATLAAA